MKLFVFEINKINMNVRIVSMILLLSFLLISCSKDSLTNNDVNDNIWQDNTLDEFLFDIKSGTIIYNYSHYNQLTFHLYEKEMKIIFDDYGKKIRSETDGEIIISDEYTGTSYILYPETKTYTDYPEMATFRVSYLIYQGDDINSNWNKYHNFTKETNRNIADKYCTVCKWDTPGSFYEWGGWNRITLLRVETSVSIQKFEAKNIIEEQVPANSFVVPSDYTKF